jgi:signal transduction histidine kinase
LEHIRADSALITQVIINLLKNAAEELEGRDRRQIVVATAASEGGIVLTFSDTGGGMDEATRRTIFAPFFTTKVGGSGLGLSVSQKIIAEHGGTISVQSELGSGSTFRVFVPWDAEEAGG